MEHAEKITLVAVGDIMLGEGMQRIGRGVRTAWHRKRIDELLGHFQPLFCGADICFGNLECMLGEVDATDPRKMVYKGESVHAPGLRALGFTHLSLANNHMLEEGPAVAEATRQVIAAARIVPCCGQNPVRYVCQNATVDFFTYNLIHDTPDFGFYRDRISDEDFDVIRASDAPIKVVSIHWGDEYSQYPSPEQIQLAHRLVNSGACLVLGHHPHVTQGIETYRGAVVAYSLGNFIFDMDWSEATRSSFILETELSNGMAVVRAVTPVRQDDGFVPWIVETAGCQQPAGCPPLTFETAPGEYLNYKEKKLLRSRVQALLYLARNFYRVDRRTWRGLFEKRLRQLGI